MADDTIESVTIIPAKPPTDIISPDGKNISEAGASLGAIFDLAEQGKPISEAIKEVNEGKAEPKEVVVEEKPADDKPVEETGLDKKLTEAQDKKDDDAAVSREKLKALTEVKPPKQESKPEVKTDVKPAKTGQDPDLTEDEVNSMPNDKRSFRRIKELWAKAHALEEQVTTTKKQDAEKAAKLAELEKKLASAPSVNPEVDAQVKAKLDELAMYRRRYELEKDPDVKTKFDSRATFAEENITSVLTKRNAGPALLKLISDSGGWTKFSESTAPITVNNADGTQDTITASQAAENILAALPLGERKQIESAMMEQISVEREKRRYFEEETKKAQEYFTAKEQEQQKQTEVQKQAMANAQKVIEDFQQEVVKKHDWLKEKEVPANATPEQKAQIDEDNNYTRQLRMLLKQNVSVKDIPSMLGIVEDSVAYYAERRNVARLTAENQALKAELSAQKQAQDKFRQAARSVSKPGSLSSPSAQQSQKKSPPVGLEAALDAIQSGNREGLTGEE